MQKLFFKAMESRLRFFGVALALVLGATGSQASEPRYLARVLEAQSGAFLGAATRICLDPELYPDARPGGQPLDVSSLSKADPDRHWWVSPAHVINDRWVTFSIDGVETDPRLEMVDAGMDLVLLSTPSAGVSSPCLPLAQRLRVQEAPRWTDEGAYVETQVRWFAEPWAKEEYVKTRSITILNASSSLPGRSASLRTLEVGNLFGFYGMSGGALIGPKSSRGLQDAPALFGLWLAFDRTEARAFSLPGTSILKRVVEHFRSGGARSVHFDRLNVPGGILYRKSGAIHHRITGGTGGLGDGGPDDAGSTSPDGGLLVGDRTWLEIDHAGESWSEGQALPDGILDALEKKIPLRGIYLENGRFYRTDSQIDLPHSGLQKWLVDIQSLETRDGVCGALPVLESKARTVFRKVLWICERNLSLSQREVWILTPEVRENSRSVRYLFRIEHRFSGLRLETRSKFSRAETDLDLTLEVIGWSKTQRAPTHMKEKGLRLFSSAEARLSMDPFRGLSIELLGAERISWVGPQLPATQLRWTDL